MQTASIINLMYYKTD